MKQNNVIVEKTYKFAIRIIHLYQYLKEEKKEYVISKQVLRCGTSIGANIEEAIGAQSDRDFFAKISISYKEARETKYWIRLLRDTDYISSNQAESLINDCEELLKIIGSIRKFLLSKMSLNS
jgi:four helix bundle protein